MKNVRATSLFVFSSITVLVGLCLTAAPAIAQNTNSPTAAQQEPAQPSGDQNSASKEATFSGKIVKMGDKLVLSDADGKVTYQLDDQQKAHEYLNQNVKVTGVLDPSTGTIRVSAIAPA